eukprot:1159892-Pelagomonas_calceolata.AAC.14
MQSVHLDLKQNSFSRDDGSQLTSTSVHARPCVIPAEAKVACGCHCAARAVGSTVTTACVASTHAQLPCTQQHASKGS